MKRWIVILLAALSFTACSSGAFPAMPKGCNACQTHTPPTPRLPYKAWSLAVVQPLYMETWVETAEVEDIRGLRFLDVYRGLASSSNSPTSFELGGGIGREVLGADLPRTIFLRWQSLVEPQTYRVRLEIPEATRRMMLTQRESSVVPGRKHYRNILSVGIAPGGTVVLWNDGVALPRVEILRAQAEVEPLGPYSGKSNGQHRPLSERSMQYIKEHGIPYGSW